MNLYLHLPVVVGTVPLRAPPYTPFDPMSPGGMELNFTAMFGGTSLGEGETNFLSFFAVADLDIDPIIHNSKQLLKNILVWE